MGEKGRSLRVLRASVRKGGEQNMHDGSFLHTSKGESWKEQVCWRIWKLDKPRPHMPFRMQMRFDHPPPFVFAFLRLLSHSEQSFSDYTQPR